MIKQTLLFLLFLYSVSSVAQTGFTRNIAIPVSSGSPVNLAWAGGINYPLFSEIDLNDDGRNDLFVFERSSNRIMTFINNGNAGTDCWDYAPEFADKFPYTHGWAFLYDYNCDNLPDLLTVNFRNNGIAQYKNVSVGSNIAFTLVDSSIAYVCACPPPMPNILASEYLVPDFNDVDNDGDMDIIGQQFLCLGGFAYYKNMSMEHYGTCDSLNDYILETNTWGEFTIRSGLYTNVVVKFWNISCIQSANEFFNYEIARRDDTNANIKTIDIDGDGDKDALIGDSQTYNSLLVVNGGSVSHATMVTQDTLFPSYDLSIHIRSFAAHAYVDADNDGIKDLIVSQSEYENKNGTYFYKNTGTNSVPVFNHIQNDFIQGKMIDVGQSATPVLFDIDGDGLKDIIVGNEKLTTSDTTSITGLTLYKNIGSLSSPAFDFVTDDFAGLHAYNNIPGQIFPAFGDLDGDNDVDMILGKNDGKLLYFMNTAGPGVPVAFTTPIDFYMAIDVNQASTPQLFDLNKDGLMDLIIGNKNNTIKYFENTGSASSPFFSSTATNDTLGGIDSLSIASPDAYAVPFLFDQGGDTRLLVSCMAGQIYLYGNIDGNLSGNFTVLDTVISGNAGSRYGYNLSVSGGDLNNDTLVDIVIGLYAGGIQIYYQDNLSSSISTIADYDAMVHILPNPVSETLIIKSTLPPGIINCILYDLTGRSILSQPLRGGYAVMDVSKLASGSYTLKVISGKATVTKKVVVAR